MGEGSIEGTTPGGPRSPRSLRGPLLGGSTSLRLRLGLWYGTLTTVVVAAIAALTLVAHAQGHPEVTTHVLALSSAAGVVLVLSIGWLMAGRALRPVAVMIEAAGTIARARSFSQRVPVVSAHDELGQLACTFNEMLASLEAAYDAERRFVSDASHELRAPLTAIQANLSLLQRQPDLPSQERVYAIDEASREASRLAQLVADLLALARADAGVALQRTTVELDLLVVEAVHAARHLARGQRLTIAALEPAEVLGDADRLKQLAFILLDNAIKYTPPEGSVVVSLARQDANAALTVRDTGIGIRQDQLPRVFERFYRTDEARARDPSGTGLGLAIARWIVQQHGGEITLASEPGRGTTACVRIPLACRHGSGRTEAAAGSAPES